MPEPSLITPNSTIKFLHNVPLDKTYEHTIYFENRATQETYFNGLAVYTVTEQSYQRLHRSIRVEILADNLYSCNYLMFKNTNFGSRWFYAFIDSIEYINNSVSEITFTIDVLQTWAFDYTLDHCFVERQHTEQDILGDNIVAEPVEVGEYVCSSDYTPITDLSDLCVILSKVSLGGTQDVPPQTVVNGYVYDGIYSGTELIAYRLNTAGIEALNHAIADEAQSIENIVSLYMCPTALIPGLTSELNWTVIGSRANSIQIEVTDALLGNERLDGYLPKNKKMYTYPFNFLSLDNANGTTLTLRYEFFPKSEVDGGFHPDIIVNGTFTQPCKVTARPKGYKNSKNGQTKVELNTEIITLTDFPMCSFNLDAFKAWIAQNSIPLGLKTIGGAAISSVALSAGYPFSVAGVGIGLITQTLMEGYRASIKADYSGGNFNNGSLNVCCGKNQIYKCRMSVNNCDAKVIDDFFTKYGYAIKRLRVPNIHARPYWTYVKTCDCTITGNNVPANDMKKICDIFNSGITWWRYVNRQGDVLEVGNYSKNNSPS